jgi:hypothetical protein
VLPHNVVTQKIPNQMASSSTSDNFFKIKF